ncbi:zinc finger protein 217-like [Pyxicephalus adspersus]|uniref:C2H2-type domain-containing protein n=1 Tax=Pyxicephalus adspersus TaxID=30357 RepID=A0AAV2ZU38_PYXAD|nr:TPA: hypothetical protein GDO54_013029 [Pyxicephalus adspersus]
MASPSSTLAMDDRNNPSQNINQENFMRRDEESMLFNCDFCTESFTHEEELGTHLIETHHARLCEPLVLCVDAEFLSPEDRHRNISGTSGEEDKKDSDSSDCEVCGQTFPDNSDLGTHMKKHKDSFIYSCDICGRRFKEPWFLKIHKKTHYSRSGGKNKTLPIPETPITINGVEQEEVTGNVTWPYKQCKDCGGICPDKEALLEHCKEKHIKDSILTENSTNFAPRVETVQGSNGEQTAKEQFLGFFNLQPASAPVQKPAAKRKCLAELDPFNTYQAWQLATTGKLALGNGKKKENSFGANMEAESSSDKDEIGEKKSVKGKKSTNVEETESVKSEDGASPIQDMDENKSPSDQEKSNYCTDCRKLFKTYHQLVLHSRVHRKERSDSESSASYDGHFMMGSPHTPADPEDNEGIKMEVVSESEEAAGNSTPTDNNEGGAFQSKGLPVSRQCGYCKKSFRSNYYLNIHLRTHTGEKPYKCDFCDYTAAQKTSLRYHLERHHNYKPGQSNELVKRISKSLQLSKKVLEEPSAVVQLPKIKSSLLPTNVDKVEFLSKPPKRMSALRNKLVSARRDQKKELAALEKSEEIKVKPENVEASTSCQPPNNPSPTPEGEEEISLVCAETLDDEPCLMETSTAENIQPSLDTVDPEPLDLTCPSTSNRLSTNLCTNDLLTRHQCPYCTYRTLYPEVLSIHQRLFHKQSYEHHNKSLRKAKNPFLVLKMRRTGCPPALHGMDVHPYYLGNTRLRLRAPSKPNEKLKRAQAQANKVNPPSAEQENRPHPAQPNNQQTGNNRFMHPDLQGITFLVDRIPQPDKKKSQWNPSSSQKNNISIPNNVPSLSGENHNIPNFTSYVNANQVNGNSQENLPATLEPRRNVLQPCEHRMPNNPGQESTTVEGRNILFTENKSEQNFGPNERST